LAAADSGSFSGFYLPKCPKILRIQGIIIDV